MYVDLEGYEAWDVVNNLIDGGKEAWKGTKTAVKTTWKALPQLNQKFSSGFDQALDNAYGTALQNNVPGMKNPLVQAGITAGITGTKAMLGMGSYPLVKAGQMSEYSADPTQLQNFPFLGTGVRDTYRAHKAYEENPTLENGLQVFQAGAGTFLEAVGAGYGAKTIKGSYGKTAPKSGMTVEGGSNQFLRFLKDETGSAGYDIRKGTAGESVSGEPVVNTKNMLQNEVNRAVSDLQANPELARSLMSPGSYKHLVERTGLADASYGKAVERLTARNIRESADLSSMLQYKSKPFVSTPDFFGYEGYNLRLLDITTEKSIPNHNLRSYGKATEYVTHPGLPKELEFPK